MNDSMDTNLSILREIVKDREAWRAALHGITTDWLNNNNEKKCLKNWDNNNIHSTHFGNFNEMREFWKLQNAVQTMVVVDIIISILEKCWVHIAESFSNARVGSEHILSE